jgi:magnesium transporter
LRTIIWYNEHEVKTNGSIDDLGSGYNVWIDLMDPEIRLLDNHTFTVVLDMKNKDPKTLETEGIYFFLGRKWIITIHSSAVKLKELVESILNVKNKKIKEATIGALYYNLLAQIVTKYEQLLTALELTVNEYQRRSFVRPSPEIFDSATEAARIAFNLDFLSLASDEFLFIGCIL